MSEIHGGGSSVNQAKTERSTALRPRPQALRLPEATMSIGDLILCFSWGTVLTMLARNLIYSIYFGRVRRFLDAYIKCSCPEDSLRLVRYVRDEYEKSGFFDILLPWRPLVPKTIWLNIKNGND